MNAIEKSAIIILTLGEKTAAAVFKHLHQQEIKIISKTITSLGFYSWQQLISVLKEFHSDAEMIAYPDKDSCEYLRSVLISALGKDHALLLLEELKINNINDITSIDALNAMKPQAITKLIHNEHPQVIAAILVLLNRNLSAEILSGFEETLRNDILIRIAMLDDLNQTAIQELTLAINDLLRNQHSKQGKRGGVRPVAEILNCMQSWQEESAINAMRAFDEILAKKIAEHIFTFNNLQDLDNYSLRRILQEIDIDALVIALKGCTPTLIDKILSNMSQRQAEILRDDLNLNIPVKKSRIETERKAILAVVRRLVDANEITIDKEQDNYV